MCRNISMPFIHLESFSPVAKSTTPFVELESRINSEFAMVRATHVVSIDRGVCRYL